MPPDPNKRIEERIYRAVDIRIHTDERVMKLSKPPPSGKGLWYELLFGEQTTIIPGLFKIGEAAFAEQLGWSLKAFRDCWKEVQDAGLIVKADWSARLVWVPNALKHNPPRNVNQIKHWRRTWDLLPACHLKNEAQQFLEQFLKQLNEQFGKQFAEQSRGGFPKQSEEGFGNTSRNQEAVSSKQEKEEVSAQSHEGNSQPYPQQSVDNPSLEGLSESDKARVQKLFFLGKATEATALLASLKRSESLDKTRPGEATG